MVHQRTGNMNLHRAIGLLFLVLCTVRCATIKPYPVCFFDCNDVKPDQRQLYTDSLASYLRKESKTVIVLPSNRWILAKTNPIKHRRLTKMWPRLACIGTVTSGTDVEENAHCTQYIYEFMSQRNYLEFDIKELSALSDEAPGEIHVRCCCELKKQ